RTPRPAHCFNRTGAPPVLPPFPTRRSSDLPMVAGVVHDSRRVRPGDLYAALPGSHHHGAEFCQDAARAGAVAVLTDAAGRSSARRCGLPVLVVADPRARLGEAADWVYRHPSGDLLLIGVTGTSGKTTTTYLLATP